MRFYLVTTDHLKSSILFRDQEDFKAAMNIIPIIAALTGIKVLAFILMSNHVHFVLEGSYEQVLKFITEFKRHHSRYLFLKYNINRILKDNQVDIKELALEDEGLERAIAYVQMNSVSAGICLSPSDYPWGTGSAFFRVVPSKGSTVDSLTYRARYRLFHTKKEIPKGLLLGEGGYILPESYVKTRFVEQLYRKPNRMGYFLRNSSKAKARLEAGDSEIPVFEDRIIIPVMNVLCRILFNKGSIAELTPNQQSEILRQIRYRFSSNVNQLVRVTGIQYEGVVRLLESL